MAQNDYSNPPISVLSHGKLKQGLPERLIVLTVHLRWGACPRLGGDGRLVIQLRGELAPKADELVPRLTFTTEDAPAGRAHEYYAGLVAVGFDVSDAGPDFSAEVTTFRLGKVIAHVSRVGSQTIRRSAERIATDGLAHLTFQLQFEGSIAGDFDGVEAFAGPGEVIVADLSRPMVLRTSAVSVISIGMMKPGTGHLAQLGRAWHGAVLNGDAGAILADYLTSLARNLPTMHAAAAEGAALALVELLAAALNGAAGGAVRNSRSDRVRDYIESHLSEDLTPARIAAAAGFSRAALYRLFRGSGGVSQVIWRRRLARARQSLVDPSETRGVAEIAAAWGFSSEAHFSRAFRRQFGHTPTQARRGAAPVAHSTPTLAPETAPLFATWVRDLG